MKLIIKSLFFSMVMVIVASDYIDYKCSQEKPDFTEELGKKLWDCLDKLMVNI